MGPTEIAPVFLLEGRLKAKLVNEIFRRRVWRSTKRNCKREGTNWDPGTGSEPMSRNGAWPEDLGD